MTQLPIGQTPQVGVPDARINPALAGGPTIAGAVAKGIKKLGDVIQRIEERKVAINRQRQTAAGRSQILVGVAEAQERASQADPMDSQTIYEEGIEKTREQIEGTTDPQALETLQLFLEEKSRLGAIPVRRDSTKRLAASAIDQYVGLIDNAILVGDEAAVRGALEGVKPLLTNKQFIELRDQTQGKIEAVKIETLKTAIDAVGQLPLEQRKAAIDFINQAVKASGLSATDKQALDTRLKSKIAVADSDTVTNIEARVGDLAREPTPETETEIRRLRESAELITNPKDRQRVLDDIDSKLRTMPAKIDAVQLLYQGVIDGSVEGLSKNPDDVNAVWKRMLRNDHTPVETLGLMLGARVGLATDARQLISLQFKPGGSPLEGGRLLQAIHTHNPILAEQVASASDPVAGAAMRGVIDGERMGYTPKQIEAVLSHPDFLSLSQGAQMVSGKEPRDEGDKGPNDFNAFNELSGIQKRFLRGLSEPARIIGSSDEQRFHDLFAFNLAAEAITKDIPSGNVEAVNAAVQRAKSLSMTTTLADRATLPTGFKGSNPVAVDSALFVPPDDPATPKTREQSEAALNAYERAVDDALSFDVFGFGMTNAFVPVALDRTVTDPKQAFDFNGKTIIPVLQQDTLGRSTGAVGFIEWDKENLTHRIIREDKDKFIARFGGTRRTVRPGVNEVFDQTLFDTLNDASPAALAEGSGQVVLTGKLAQLRWQPGYGNMASAAGHSEELANGYLQEALTRIALDRAVGAEELKRSAATDKLIMFDVENLADRMARQGGWPNGLGGDDDADSR